jgi:hypothetical protein
MKKMQCRGITFGLAAQSNNKRLGNTEGKFSFSSTPFPVNGKTHLNALTEKEEKKNLRQKKGRGMLELFALILIKY